MAKWERLVIYPLLTLALIYGLIGIPGIEAQTGRIIATEIVVVDQNNNPIIWLGNDNPRGLNGKVGIITYRSGAVLSSPLIKLGSTNMNDATIELNNSLGRNLVAAGPTLNRDGGVWVYDSIGVSSTLYGFCY